MNGFQYTLNVGGRLLNLSQPKVMGILNCTPDSFYEGSRVQTEAAIADRAHAIVNEGGAVIDVGAFSTRPGGVEVGEDEEMARLRFALSVVRRELPDALLSVDTFRPDVARMCVEEFGVGIINDVSEGGITGIAGKALTPATDDGVPAMFRMVAQLGVPYILMSVKPTMREMALAFAKEVQQLRALGQKDIILDPGFGFGKTLEQNYSILSGLEELHALGLPLLIGLSRKTMIWKLLDITPAEALNGTTALHMVALMKGASLLRVHDVKACAETIRIYQSLNI